MSTHAIVVVAPVLAACAGSLAPTAASMASTIKQRVFVAMGLAGSGIVAKRCPYLLRAA